MGEHSLGCPAEHMELGTGEACHWPCRLYVRSDATMDKPALKELRDEILAKIALAGGEGE